VHTTSTLPRDLSCRLTRVPEAGSRQLARIWLDPCGSADVFDDRLLDPEQGSPWGGVLHAVLRSSVPDLDKPGT